MTPFERVACVIFLVMFAAMLMTAAGVWYVSRGSIDGEQ